MTVSARTVVIRRQGGPEVMEWEDRLLGEPGPGEIRIRHEAIGLNFLDTYQRSGVYQVALPATLGQEGAGIVKAVGEGVAHVAPGDRAAYGGGPSGAYAEGRVMPAGAVVKLPDAVSFEDAAAVIDYRAVGDVAAEVRRLTEGRGVDVVMDGVGRDTFDASLDALRPLGTMISFGNASGKVPPFDIMTLAAKGSLKITRPTIFTHIAEPETCRAMAADLFGKIESGAVRALIDQRFRLSEVAAAHKALEARATTGSTVLLP